MANASQQDLSALKAWRDDIRREAAEWLDHVKIRSDVGVKLSAALFNKETDIRQQMTKALELAPACTVARTVALAKQLPHTDASLPRRRQDHLGHGGR
jgi:hypothetical protein